MSSEARPANRLAKEISPYLLQHAHNPVDWYPWGPEAFAAARAQDKPIFLSVGYSACYWCHVMERQSFENPAVAAEMNRRFINVKVDREERPDVDQLYMNAVQALTGQGGWPMSVFLTPDLKPFYGGTYFPPADGHGRVGFPRLLAAIDDAWRNRREQVLTSADELVDLLGKMTAPPPRSAVRIDEAFISNLLDRSTADYDPVNGGFGSAPKFPRQTLLELILIAERNKPNQTHMEQLVQTLDAMARGGIHDHLGGAFHRYSTDNYWLVPHFEIMLYDNAMLAWIYAETFALTKEPRHAAVARSILDFILREMTSPDGAFYTAIDAEVDAQEGMPYLWTAEEITEALGVDAELFNRVYGVSAGPNFADPHHGHGAPDKSILFLAEAIDAEIDARLAPMRRVLYERRRRRKQPLLDTKILTSWNALMIRAMAHAGNVLGERKYLTAAGRAADYLLRVHRTLDGALHRTSRDGKAKGNGFLDDYAMLAQAFLALNRTDEAERVVDLMCERFLDRDKGGFFFTSGDDPEIIVRQKTASDTPLPSGNAVAAMVVLELGQTAIAHDAIAIFAGQLSRFGEGMSALAEAALRYVHLHASIDSGPTEGEAAVVSMQAKWSAKDRLVLLVTVVRGFHVNGHETSSGLTPTRLSVAGQNATIDYPPARSQKFPFADEPIPIYDGTFSIGVRFAGAAPRRPVKLLLQCQPCDETSCQAARILELVVK